MQTDVEKKLRWILTRRSTRRYKKEMPEDRIVAGILEAGRHAPSGGNSQNTRFFVIKNRAVLEQLVRMAEAAFAKMEVTEGMYRSLVASIRAAKQGGYDFTYGAPVLIVLANRRGYDNGMADVACAIENMLLAANALDLGACYINQLKWLNEEPGITELFRTYGLQDEEQILGSVAIGYADREDGLPGRTILPRSGNPVVWI